MTKDYYEHTTEEHIKALEREIPEKRRQVFGDELLRALAALHSGEDLEAPEGAGDITKEAIEAVGDCYQIARRAMYDALTLLGIARDENAQDEAIVRQHQQFLAGAKEIEGEIRRPLAFEIGSVVDALETPLERLSANEGDPDFSDAANAAMCELLERGCKAKAHLDWCENLLEEARKQDEEVA